MRKRKVQNGVEPFQDDPGEFDVEAEGGRNEQFVLQLDERHPDVAIIEEGGVGRKGLDSGPTAVADWGGVEGVGQRLAEDLDEVGRFGEGVQDFGGDGQDGDAEEVAALEGVVDWVVEPKSVEDDGGGLESAAVREEDLPSTRRAGI